MKILHLSDIHIGSGFCHGRINPETGKNTRFEDFVNSLSTCIDRAIEEPVDIVLFGGDAFPDATPPPYVQEAFAKQFQRLVEHNIPTILLVGNHDQHSQGVGGASLSIYRTLGVPGFIVGDTPTTHRISTANGDIQVITLPWLNRSALLTRPETEGLSMEEVDSLLLKKLEPVIEHEIRRLDPNIPTVLLGHIMADRASLGAERLLAVGRGFTIPISLFIRPELDYVALGHVHKHQNLNKNNNPPIIYPGSIERVDFSEEKEDKGYILVHVEKGNTSWEFCRLPVRKFITIEVDVSESEEPQKKLLQAVKKETIDEAVVRLIYKIRKEQIDLVSLGELNKALQTAHTFTIRPELVTPKRSRLPELGAGNSLDPLQALQVYLNTKGGLKDLTPSIMAAAQELLASL